MPAPAASAGLEVAIRRATTEDLPALLTLGTRCLGWLGDDVDAAFFAWKHLDNPFGASPMWVAEVDGRIVGFRAFLRWVLTDPGGGRCHAVRTVDTATDPDFQGRGIFRALTEHALDELRADGVDFVFNTPNDRSRPGYLTMGWRVAGRLPAAVRLGRPGALLTLARSRRPAALGAVATTVGLPAAEVLADRDAVARLLAGLPTPSGLATRHSPESLAWRYGLAALHYRAVPTGSPAAGIEDGLVVFHLRRRGSALEAVVCDVLAPGDGARGARAAATRIAAETGADYLLRLDRPGSPPVGRDGFMRVPRAGPVLTVRALCRQPPAAVAGWDLSMGDIEVF